MATATQAQSSHPPGCYYANPFSATVQRQCNPLGVIALAAAGFIGDNGLPATPGTAFQTFEEALAVAQETHGGTQGGLGSVTPNVANPLTGVNAIGDFFQRLTQPNTWIRVGEFVAGGLLLYLGGSALLRNTEVQQHARTARRGGSRTVKTAKTIAKVAAK